MDEREPLDAVDPALLVLHQLVLGLEAPPPGVRHFLPPVERTISPGRRFESGWAFEGYAAPHRERYIQLFGRGDCLAPDIAGEIVSWFDPGLEARPGDIGLIAIHLPELGTYFGAKYLQQRNGRLWACSNDGDFPLSEHAQLVGRMVATVVPRGATPVAF